MRNLGNHVQAAIVRGVTDQAGLLADDRQKTILIVESLQSTDWASATFVGANHRLHLRLQGPADGVTAAIAALGGLPTREFSIPGHILAEIACDWGPTFDVIGDDIVAISLTVNALTILD